MKMINNLRVKVAVLIIFLLSLSLPFIDTKFCILSDFWSRKTAAIFDKVSPYDYNAFLLLSTDTVNTLKKKRDFLVVFGIPSLDIPQRRWRRRMQRTTCWQFPEVATLYNNYTGAMLVLYLLARHLFNNFNLSHNVIREAEQWQDVLIHPMNEGIYAAEKDTHSTGSWGLEAEIGLSRKTFFWFYFALRQFPRVPFIAKGDDDMFLRVPQYLADVRRLPMQGIYWGGYMNSKQIINNNGDTGDVVAFMIGYCVTLARDVVEAFVSFKPLQKLIWAPYSSAMIHEFRALNMDHDNFMVGRVLKLSGHPVIWVLDDGERFHRNNDTPPTQNVVVTHTPQEHEYYLHYSQFLVNNITSKPTCIMKQSPKLYLMRPPL